jgi:hypothetical protein
MARVAKGDIKAGLSRVVGQIEIDPGGLRGEAGPLEPRLVIPLSVVMNPRPPGEMLALLRLNGTLHLGDSNNPATQVGLPATVDLLRGFYARSVPSGPVGCKYDVEFESQPSRADARALNALTSGAGRALLRPVFRPPTGH